MIAANSRYAFASFVYPSPYTDPVGFVDAIADAARRYGASVLIPIHEEIMAVAKYRARLILSPDLEDVYELIKQGTPLGSKEIAEKLNIHQNTALKRLRHLEEKGLICKQGSGPRVRYSV